MVWLLVRVVVIVETSANAGEHDRVHGGNMTTQPDIDPAYNFACPVCATTMGYQGLDLEAGRYPFLDVECRNCGFVGSRAPGAFSLRDRQLAEAMQRYTERRMARTDEDLADDVAEFHRKIKNLVCDPDPELGIPENGLATIECPWCVDDIRYTDTFTMKKSGRLRHRRVALRRGSPVQGPHVMRSRGRATRGPQCPCVALLVRRAVTTRRALFRALEINSAPRIRIHQSVLKIISGCPVALCNC